MRGRGRRIKKEEGDGEVTNEGKRERMEEDKE